MKKTFAMILTLLVISSLFASPLPFGLDSSYEFDELESKGFTLEREKSGSIIIEPPLSVKKKEEAGILDLHAASAPDEKGKENWLFMTMNWRSSYESLHDYVASLYGKSTGERRTRFLIDDYGMDLSPDLMASLVRSGKLSEHLTNMALARISYRFGGAAEASRIDMWQNEEIMVLSMEIRRRPVALWVNKSFIRHMNELNVAEIEKNI